MKIKIFKCRFTFPSTTTQRPISARNSPLIVWAGSRARSCFAFRMARRAIAPAIGERRGNAVISCQRLETLRDPFHVPPRDHSQKLLERQHRLGNGLIPRPVVNRGINFAPDARQ